MEEETQCWAEVHPISITVPFPAMALHVDRNTKENHGNIFNDCTFKGLGKDAVIGRLPDNKGRNYPDAECVLLNCTLDGVPAEGFGPVDETASTAILLEFNSHDKEGKTIDISKRNGRCPPA